MSADYFFGVFALLIVVSLVSYLVGHKRGKAVGWLEHHFADIAKERARRDGHGRFTAVRGVPPTAGKNGR